MSQASASFSKLQNGEWGIRVRGNARAGQQVSVTKRDGGTSPAIVEKVLWAGDGVSICSIEPREPAAGSGRQAPSRQQQPAASGNGSRQGNGQRPGAGRPQPRIMRPRPTGCDCGSIQGQACDGDCNQCRYDSGE
jgi:hypothetical protein